MLNYFKVPSSATSALFITAIWWQCPGQRCCCLYAAPRKSLDILSLCVMSWWLLVLIQNLLIFISSYRSSYSDSVLLYIQQQQQHPLFEILSISADIHVLVYVPWGSMMFYDVLWCSMMFYDVLWCSLMFYDVLWCSMMSVSYTHLTLPTKRIV